MLGVGGQALAAGAPPPGVCERRGGPGEPGRPRGRRACTLFTDLANPTSNWIYADVGYRRFADWEEH